MIVRHGTAFAAGAAALLLAASPASAQPKKMHVLGGGNAAQPPAPAPPAPQGPLVMTYIPPAPAPSPLVATYVPPAAPAPTGQPGKFTARLTSNGQPVADDALVTMPDGRQMTVAAYRAIVEGYLNSLHARGLIDTQGHRTALFDGAATARAEACARAAASSAANQSATVQHVTPTAARTAFLPPSGARVPFGNLAAPSDTKHAWSTHVGDQDWVALDLSTNHELSTWGRATLFQADASADLTVRGSSRNLAHGSVTMSATAGLATAQGDIEFNGQTLWAVNDTNDTEVKDNPGVDFPQHVDLDSFDVPTSIVPVTFSAWLDGHVGFAAVLWSKQSLTNDQAWDELLLLRGGSAFNWIDDQHTFEGAYAFVKLSGQARVDVSIASIADEFGIAGDIVRYLDLNETVGGAQGTLSVDLLLTQLQFDVSSEEYYTDDGSTQDYVLAGWVNSSLALKAIMNPTLDVSAWVNVPTGFSVDFSWDWPPVDVSIDWTRIGYDHAFGSRWVGLDASVSLLGQQWSQIAQETHLTARPDTGGAVGAN